MWECVQVLENVLLEEQVSLAANSYQKLVNDGLEKKRISISMKIDVNAGQG